MTTSVGVVLSVDVVKAGVDVLEPASVGDSSMVGVDAFDLPTEGGVVELPDGSVVVYVSADHDEDVVAFAAPLTVALEEGERLLVRPVRSYTQATVQLEDEGGTIPVRVPHTMQQALPVGPRVDDPEQVTVEVREDGSFWIDDVHDRPPLEVWGDPEGAAAEMRDTGLSFYTMGPTARYEATRLGSGQDRLAVNNAEGQIVGGITADGRVVGQSGAIAGDLSVGGVPLMGRLWDSSPGASQGWLDRFAAGHVVAAPFDDSGPSRPASELWGYAKVGFSARAGRSYSVEVEETVLTGAAYMTTGLHVTTDGSEPTISTPTLGDRHPNSPSDGVIGVQVRRLFASTTDASVKVLVSHVSFGGSHTVARANLVVTDLGPQGTYGGGTYTTGRESTPPPTVRQYTSVWTATGFRVYDETGQPITDAPEPRQWGPAGDPDRDHSAIEFTGTATAGNHAGETISTATSTATLVRAEVFLANTSWGGADAGTVDLGKGGVSSLPPTLAPQATVRPQGWPTGGGMWVEVPVSWFSDANRVVTLGDVDGGVMGGWFMGPDDEFPPQVRLTYTK